MLQKIAETSLFKIQMELIRDNSERELALNRFLYEHNKLLNVLEQKMKSCQSVRRGLE